ncbi:MAG: hypothetical protein HY678_10065 [Chloroflexi bacterium]|nr:hypothetical protein [Chloroflexota bacterium]
MKRFVVLFGTSANPPTGMGGHAGMVAWAAARDDVDEIWVVPVYRHAVEEKRDMPSFAHRFEMARLAFEQLSEKVRVLDAERRLAESLGSDSLIEMSDVVRDLARLHPDAEFGLLLGADTYRDLMAGKWKESEALRGMVRIIPVPRKGMDEDFPGPELEVVSSTECRETTDLGFLSRALQPEVLRYMQQHRLYAFARV